MEIDNWAADWEIGTVALNDLKARLGLVMHTIADHGLTTEGGIQNLIRAEASRKGARLWRNNVGAATTADGSFIRFGLANDSSGLNKILKSADLIGINPVQITQDMVGCVIGQFISREVKTKNWRYTGTAREQAQLKWIELILSLGGNACFANGEGTII